MAATDGGGGAAGRHDIDPHHEAIFDSMDEAFGAPGFDAKAWLNALLRRGDAAEGALSAAALRLRLAGQDASDGIAEAQAALLRALPAAAAHLAALDARTAALAAALNNVEGAAAEHDDEGDGGYVAELRALDGVRVSLEAVAARVQRAAQWPVEARDADVALAVAEAATAGRTRSRGGAKALREAAERVRAVQQAAATLADMPGAQERRGVAAALGRRLVVAAQPLLRAALLPPPGAAGRATGAAGSNAVGDEGSLAAAGDAEVEADDDSEDAAGRLAHVTMCIALGAGRAHAAEEFVAAVVAPAKARWQALVADIDKSEPGAAPGRASSSVFASRLPAFCVEAQRVLVAGAVRAPEVVDAMSGVGDANESSEPWPWAEESPSASVFATCVEDLLRAMADDFRVALSADETGGAADLVAVADCAAALRDWASRLASTAAEMGAASAPEVSRRVVSACTFPLTWHLHRLGYLEGESVAATLASVSLPDADGIRTSIRTTRDAANQAASLVSAASVVFKAIGRSLVRVDSMSSGIQAAGLVAALAAPLSDLLGRVGVVVEMTSTTASSISKPVETAVEAKGKGSDDDWLGDDDDGPYGGVTSTDTDAFSDVLKVLDMCDSICVRMKALNTATLQVLDRARVMVNTVRSGAVSSWDAAVASALLDGRNSSADERSSSAELFVLLRRVDEGASTFSNERSMVAAAAGTVQRSVLHVAMSSIVRVFDSMPSLPCWAAEGSSEGAAPAPYMADVSEGLLQIVALLEVVATGHAQRSTTMSAEDFHRLASDAWNVVQDAFGQPHTAYPMSTAEKRAAEVLARAHGRSMPAEGVVSAEDAEGELDAELAILAANSEVVHERSSSHEADPDVPRALSTLWLGAAGRQTATLFMSAVLRIPRLTDAGGIQLSVDAAHLCELLRHLQLDVPTLLQRFARAIGLPRERVTAVLEQASGRGAAGDASEAALLRRIASMRGALVSGF